MKRNFLINKLPPLSKKDSERLDTATAVAPDARRVSNLYKLLRNRKTGTISFRSIGQSVVVYPALLSLRHAGMVDLTHNFVDNSLTWKLLEVPSNLGKLLRSTKGSGELWKVETEAGGEPLEFTSTQNRQLYYAFAHEPKLLEVYLTLNAARGPKLQDINLRAMAAELGITRSRLTLFFCDLVAMDFIDRKPLTTSMEILFPPETCPMEETVSDSVIQVWLSGPSTNAEDIQEEVGKNNRRAPAGTETLIAFAQEVEEHRGRKVFLNGRQWKFPASRLVKQTSLWDLARMWHSFSGSGGGYGSDRYGYTMYTMERHMAEIEQETSFGTSSVSSLIGFMDRNDLIEKWVPNLVSADNKVDVYEMIEEFYRLKFVNQFRSRVFAGEFNEELTEDFVDTLATSGSKDKSFWIALADELELLPEKFLPDSMDKDLKRMKKKSKVTSVEMLDEVPGKKKLTKV